MKLGGWQLPWTCYYSPGFVETQGTAESPTDGWTCALASENCGSHIIEEIPFPRGSSIYRFCSR